MQYVTQRWLRIFFGNTEGCGRQLSACEVKSHSSLRQGDNSLQEAEGTDKPNWGHIQIELFYVSPELFRANLFNKHIFTLKSRDMYPTEAEIMGVLSIARQISNNAFVLFNYLIFSSRRSNSKLVFLYMFLIRGIGKHLTMVVHPGYHLDSLLLEFLMWDIVSRLVLSSEQLHCPEAIPLFSGGRCDRLQLIVFTSRWQDWLNHKADCVLWKQLDFLSGKDKTKQKGNRELVKGMGESDRNRNELIFYLISLHVPRGKRCLTYSRAVYLPGINCLSPLCLIFSLPPHLGHFSLDWHFHLGVQKGNEKRWYVKIHQLCNSLAIRSSLKGLDKAFGEKLLAHEGRRSLSSSNYETCVLHSSMDIPWILHHFQGPICNSSSLLPIQESRKNMER